MYWNFLSFLLIFDMTGLRREGQLIKYNKSDKLIRKFIVKTLSSTFSSLIVLIIFIFYTFSLFLLYSLYLKNNFAFHYFFIFFNLYKIIFSYIFFKILIRIKLLIVTFLIILTPMNYFVERGRSTASIKSVTSCSTNFLFVNWFQ